MWKKVLCLVGIIQMLSLVGCSSSLEKENKDYLRCNATSSGNMAEIESGFFYVVNEILYYADKDDITQWVAVCNKPNCNHNMGNTSCNAYIFDNNIVQKGEELYGVSVNPKTTHPYVYQVITDGSGLKHIYDLPVEKDIWINGFKAMLSQEQLIFYYKYMQEDGTFKRNLVRLENEKSHILYTDCVENDDSVLNMTGMIYWNMRGDDVIVSSLLTDADDVILNTFWDINGEEPVCVDIPKDASLLGSYISDDTFRYFEKNEGFYEVDLISGKKKLICENQLENSRGYVLTEQYMIECNRYANYMPKEAYLKFYDGGEWLNVELPEDVKKSNGVFNVLSVASDRIFIKQSVNGGTYNQLYYFMLDEENPKLILCSEFGVEKEEETTIEISSEEESIEIIDIEDIIVFDTEKYFFKITSIEPNHDEGYKVNVYWENRSDKTEYEITMYIAGINGIFHTNGWRSEEMLPKTSLEESIYFRDKNFSKSYKFIVPELYDYTQYTDIECVFQIRNEKGNEYEYKVINIYPYGEDATIRYEYEIQDSDNIIINNEYAMVVVTGFEQIDDATVAVNLYILNKSNKPAYFTINECLVNGERIKNIGSWNVAASQNMFANFVMMKVGNLENIEEIKWNLFAMRDSVTYDEEGMFVGEIYFEEDMIILNP